MILTNRQKFVVRAALAYALSNADDLNDALLVEPSHNGASIRVGGTLGPPLIESEVQALINLFDPPSHTPTAGMRTFTGTFLVSTDPDDADVDERHFALDGLIDFLKDAVALDVDMEGTGNPLGVQGVELLLETLEELPADDVRQ